jgi:tetratricopeptide (TPR) repeat protein
MMAKRTFLIILCTVFFLALMISLPGRTIAEGPTRFVPDKALCAKMLRFGKEAYSRGKYLDAKEYFRKAVQADPDSREAWRYYDQAVIFALAEKVEKNAGLTLPGVSKREETGQANPEAAPPPPVAKKPQGKEGGSKIKEDEGC